jgi:cell division protein FtsB
MAYRKKLISHKGEIYYLVSIFLVVAGILISLWMPGGYLEMRRTQRELEAQQARVELLRKKTAERAQTTNALKSDPKAIEKVAREMRYAKQGEIIQQLPPQPPPPKR